MTAEAQRLFDIWEHKRPELQNVLFEAEDESQRHYGSLTLDVPRRWVIWKGQQVHGITEKEFHIIETLAKRGDCIFSRIQLLDLFWGDDDVFDRAVDTMVKKIRTKFRAVDRTFNQIGTRYNAGYFWRSEANIALSRVA